MHIEELILEKIKKESSSSSSSDEEEEEHEAKDISVFTDTTMLAQVYRQIQQQMKAKDK